ncbi:MAG: sigma 54-interacting transcriptional regulator [Gemmatimonadetes bacterium]|nr:sigma 54-interacting transcriptional regulator [Gemmatimonadota bacterium]
MSPSMRRAVERARAFAGTSLPILLVGPTGTGKEVLAQAIHAWSARDGRMVEVNWGRCRPTW